MTGRYHRSLHDALPICDLRAGQEYIATLLVPQRDGGAIRDCRGQGLEDRARDRKSTRLHSSHVAASYAVFRLQKKKKDARINGVEEVAVFGHSVAASFV